MYQASSHNDASTAPSNLHPFLLCFRQSMARIMCTEKLRKPTKSSKESDIAEEQPSRRCGAIRTRVTNPVHFLGQMLRIANQLLASIYTRSECGRKCGGINLLGGGVRRTSLETFTCELGEWDVVCPSGEGSLTNCSLHEVVQVP